MSNSSAIVIFFFICKKIEYLCTVIPMVILCLYDEDDEEPLRTLQGATKSLRSRKKTDE